MNARSGLKSDLESMDDAFCDRMSRQQAEQARRSFEFPGWVCLGIMDMTASHGGWGVIIAPIGETDDFSVYLSWRLWLHDWQLACQHRAIDRVSGPLFVKVGC